MKARSISSSLFVDLYLMPFHRQIPPCFVGGTIYAPTNESFWSMSRTKRLFSLALSESEVRSPVFKRSYGTIAKKARPIGIAGSDAYRIRRV